MKALIVEDDKTTALLMEKIFTRYGECEVINSSIDASETIIKAISNGDYYDVICLDYMMPKVDGLTVLKGIRKFEKAKGKRKLKAAKVFLFSALYTQKNVQKATELGCDEFIKKPVDPLMIEELLSRHELI